MKTSITLLFIIAFTGLTFSQKNFLIPKNTWVIEGNFGINNNNSKSNKTNYKIESNGFSFSISPKVGNAISKNLILGLGLGYHYWDKEQTNLQDSNTSSYSNNSFSIFPYIKKIFPLGSKFAVHIQGETSLSSNKHKAKNNNESYTSTSKSLFIGLRPGFNYKLSKKVLLQANFGSLGYSSTESENLNNNSINSKSNNFSLSLSSSNLTFGVAVLL